MDRRLDPTFVETVLEPVAAPSRPAPDSPSCGASDPPSRPASPSAVSPISSISQADDEGRFVSGTLLGGRYRIIGLLGRGGMGEVYRATDLTLGQSVALKFLPEEAAASQRLLERFHGEVRIARQVSHPNVCRVYDIGQVEGMPFISMEYVDGEDLASLLLRIGRLPCDKALETARKLCAGLAAAHARGVIHRDLKPQNIMINKRGEVVIMDFGLAAIADQLSSAEIRNGTPAYMAPEQLKGAEVTFKSDIYALGLVIYELCTGRRPYEAKTLQQLLAQQESGRLNSMNSMAADIDPAIEKVIRRCLEPNPSQRPAGALAVAAALPGGDRLAAALAAGETPTPEAVASHGEVGGLPQKYSIPCMALIFVCIVAAIAIRSHYSVIVNAPLDDSPEVLAHKARALAASFGYTKKPGDTALSLIQRADVIDGLNDMPSPKKWDELLAAESPVGADYRESLGLLTAAPYGTLTTDNPPPTRPGMIRVFADGAGQLREFSAVPYRDSAGLPKPVKPDALFRAAGLDIAAFTETPPKFVPSTAADLLQSWTGPHPKLPKVYLTVNMASWKGRPTRFSVVYKWPEKIAEARSAAGKMANLLRALFVLSVATFGVFGGVALARRNWKTGRVDRKGAMRVAMAQFFLAMLVWVGTVHAAPDESMFNEFLASGANWLMAAALTWLVYLALEPAVRARWPHSLVTWNRVLEGRWLDAQVNAHILIGAAVGSALWVLAELFADSRAQSLVKGGEHGLTAALGTRQWVAMHAATVAGAMSVGLIVFLAISGLRHLVRKDALAAILGALLFTLAKGDAFNSPDWALQCGVFAVIYTVLVIVLLRFGLVVIIAAAFFVDSFDSILLGSDWKTWYAPANLATVVLLLSIGAFAFWRSLGSQEFFGGEEAT